MSPDFQIPPGPEATREHQAYASNRARILDALESNLLRYVVRYGDRPIFTKETQEAGLPDLTVTGFICQELKTDDIVLENPLFNRMLAEAESHLAQPFFKPERHFLNHPDPQVSLAAASMIIDPYELSKIHSRHQPVSDDADRLDEIIPRVLLELKNGILLAIIAETENKLKAAAASRDDAGSSALSAQLMELQDVRKDLAKNLGDRIIVRH
jgi:DNA primase